MNYGYIRVSSKTQNIARKLEEIKKFKLENKNIYVDKESGKDFNRNNYQKLIKRLKKNDLIIIKSIDRLGRNYNMILEEWHKITKVIKADIFVIDMPLLDTRNNPENLIGRFISDIVLQLLSFISENERYNIKERQAEGIRLAKARGVKFGRPQKKIPINKINIFKQFLNKEITCANACDILKVSRSTFYKLLNEYKKA